MIHSNAAPTLPARSAPHTGAGPWPDPAADGSSTGHQALRAEALAAFDRGDLREALRLWRQVLSSTARTKDALFQVACCHALLDEPAQACHAFMSVADDDGVDPGLRRRAAELARLVDPIA